MGSNIFLNSYSVGELEGLEPTHPSWSGARSHQCHPSFGGWGTNHRITES